MVNLKTKINEALDAFDTWFSVNKLKLNMDKTHLMLFKTNSKSKDNLYVRINGSQIDQVDAVKFLGIRIDSKLSWKDELQDIESSICSACFALRTLRDELDVQHLKMIYHSIVESKLRYSIRFWGNGFRKNINRAFVLQKRAIRTMTRTPQWVSCRELFVKLRILTLPSLFVHVLLTSFVKNLHETEEDRQVRLATRT
jgi:hypothetical protein